MGYNNLMFVERLGDSDILELIDACYQEYKASLSDPSSCMFKTYKDGDCLRFMTRDIQNLICSYQITDFSMDCVVYSQSNEVYSRHNMMVGAPDKIDLSEILKKFMTKKFGEKYINMLYNLRIAAAVAEADNLTDYLSTTRK